MFTVTKEDIALILKDFGIFSDIITFSELQRYHYEKNNPASQEVRLIIKANLNHGQSVVVRFKNEWDTTLKVINDQSRFAKFLSDNGIKTPALFMANHEYARWYTINKYDVIVTVEEFVTGEIHIVSKEIAEKTGRLLAQMHNIAEAGKFHVQNGVIFNTLNENDLFSFQDFQVQKDFLLSVDESLYKDIVKEYDSLYQKIGVFENEPMTAKSAYLISIDAVIMFSTMMQSCRRFSKRDLWITQKKSTESRKA